LQKGKRRKLGSEVGVVSLAKTEKTPSAAQRETGGRVVGEKKMGECEE